MLGFGIGRYCGERLDQAWVLEFGDYLKTGVWVRWGGFVGCMGLTLTFGKSRVGFGLRWCRDRILEACILGMTSLPSTNSC